jgi:hypothetical protein
MNQNISTIFDVASFFRHLIEVESLNFHPDEAFENYINIETGLPSYTPEEAELRNRMMEKCFEVCEQVGADIYGIGAEILMAKLNLQISTP